MGRLEGGRGGLVGGGEGEGEGEEDEEGEGEGSGGWGFGLGGRSLCVAFMGSLVGGKGC